MTAPEHSEDVQSVFQEGFMPLPLTLASYEDYGYQAEYLWHTAPRAVQYDPQLAAAAAENGKLIFP